MANVYTASYLIASAQRRGQIPASSDRSFSFDDLLALLSEEVQTYLASMVMSVREEFFVRAFDFATTSGQVEYRVPSRAIGSKVRQVLMGTPPQSFFLVQRVEPKDQYLAQYGTYGSGINSYGVGYAPGYIFRDTVIQLLSGSPSGQTLRMMVFVRPNRIVSEDAVGTITAIDTAAHTVTVDELPLTMQTPVKLDLVRSEPGFESLAMDLVPTNVNTGTKVLTFASLPTGVYAPSVGDFVCLAGEAPVAQLPVELQPLLTQRLVVKVLEALGDPKVTTSKAMCDEQLKAALGLITPRDEGTARFVKNYNAPGWGPGRYGGRY